MTSAFTLRTSDSRKATAIARSESVSEVSALEPRLRLRPGAEEWSDLQRSVPF
jgi:hypothetical protein